MSGWEQTTKYRCDSDCRESGCPGHEVVISYRTTSSTCRIRGLVYG